MNESSFTRLNRTGRGVGIVKFLHAADLHIDSPLRGLRKNEEAPADEIRRAPREAFRQLVALAHKEAVDFVVLSGDIFDGSATGMQSAAFFNSQLRALAPIPVYIVRGNHDAETVILRSLTFPDNAHMFSSERAETKVLEEIKVAIHGRSYETAAVTEDLSATYPAPLQGYTNIGVLHTSIGGYQEHENYAPCTVQGLIAHGYDYWALGHIHAAQVVNKQDPLIVFPGNIQGRHVKETGPKGCYLVRRDKNTLVAEFRPLDSVRWFNETVDVSSAGDPAGAIALAVAQIETLQAEHGERILCVRVTMTGATEAHRDLVADSDLHEAELRSRVGSIVWVEQLRIHTASTIDLAAVKEQDDVPGALFRAIDALRANPGDESIAAVLKPLKERIPADVVKRYGTRLDSDEFVREALDGAERILVSLMSNPT